MSKQVQFEGQTHEFPDDFSDADISSALDQVSAHSKLTSTVQKLGRTINSTAGGAGYGDAIADNRTADDTGFVAGVKRAYSGLVKMPGQLLNKTPQDEYEVPGNTVAGTAYNALKRAVVDPTREAAKKRDYYDLVSQAHPEQADEPQMGSRHMSNMWQIATGVPVVGPLAGNIAERAVTGDPYGAAGETAALVTMPKTLEKGGEILKRTAGKVAFPMAGKMVKTPSGTGAINPVDAYTPKEIQDFAEDPAHGTPVNMTPAEITEHGGLRAVQGVGQKSLFGKGRLQEHQAVAQAAVIDRSRGLMTKLSPDTANTVQAARDLQGQVTDASKQARQVADQAYAQWRQTLPGGIEIDMSPLQQKYGNMLDANRDIFDNIPNDQSGRLKAAMGKARDFGQKSTEQGEFGPEESINPSMDLEAVREMRSHWLDAKREIVRKGRADSREAGLYSDVVGDLDGAIEKGIREHVKGASTGTEPERMAAADQAVDGWRQANAKYKQYVEDFHGDDSVLADILNTPQTDLVKMPGKILEKATGGNPIHIDQMRKYGIGLGGLQREVTDRALNSGFRTSQNRLAGFDDDFLQHLFADNPTDLDSLYKNARIGRSVGVDFNPSNTAGALAGRSEFEAPIKAGTELATGNVTGAAAEAVNALPGWAASRLSTSKLFKKWMTNTPENPLGKWLTGAKSKLVQGGPNTPPAAGGPPVPPSAPPDSRPGSGGTGPVTPETPAGASAPASEPQWPAEYQGAASRLTKNDEGGANYTAEDLAKLKAKHGLEKNPEAPKVKRPDLRYSPSELRRMSKKYQAVADDKSASADDRATAKTLAAQYGEMAEEAGNTQFNYGANKLKKSKDVGDGEGPKTPTPGRGPGAMLRRGSKLIDPMKSGPQTGDTANPILKRLDRANVGLKSTPINPRKSGVSGVYTMSPYASIENIDPKTLAPTQDQVQPGRVNRYMDEENPLQGDDRVPTMVDEEGGQGLLLNGHHRAIAAIKKDRTLTGVVHHTPGRGPGAMLAKGSKLSFDINPGPATGEAQTLYHGTQTANVPKILEEGLKTRNVWERGETPGDNLYVSRTPQKVVDSFRSEAESYPWKKEYGSASRPSSRKSLLKIQIPKAAPTKLDDAFELDPDVRIINHDLHPSTIKGVAPLRGKFKAGEWGEGDPYEGVDLEKEFKPADKVLAKLKKKTSAQFPKSPSSSQSKK